MVEQCHRSYQHEFDPTPGRSGRQEGLVCSGPWSHEELGMTKRLNNICMAALHVLKYYDVCLNQGQCSPLQAKHIPFFPHKNCFSYN